MKESGNIADCTVDRRISQKIYKINNIGGRVWTHLAMERQVWSPRSRRPAVLIILVGHY